MDNLEKKNKVKIDIFRHGEARYRQEEVPIEEADDLTEEGIEKVKKNAELIAESIKPDEEVAIWSSPTGRTLHTAKIIEEVLSKKNIPLREGGIRVFKELGEVKKLSWDVFASLVFGGEIECGGKKFFIDKNKTNPKNLNPREYFINDEAHKIPQAVKDELPEEYLQTIQQLEKYGEATQRIIRALERLEKLKDKNYRVIITTHEALTCFLANIFSQERTGLEPGEFISLEAKEGKLIVNSIGEEKTLEEKDVVSEFNKFKNKKP